MYSHHCNFYHSSCFCNCHRHYLNQSDDYSYQMTPCEFQKYETAQFRQTYSKGYEGDTMTSLSEKWKYSQSSQLDQYYNDNSINKETQAKHIPNQNEYSCATFQPKKPNCELENFNEYEQPINKPNIDELIKENERLMKMQSNFANEEAQDKRGNQFQIEQEIKNNSTGVFYDNKNNNYLIHREILDESLGFVRYLANKKGENYVDDKFYIENIDSYRQLLNTLKKKLDDKTKVNSRIKDESKANQFDALPNENLPITGNKNQVEYYPQKQLETTQKPNIQIKQDVKKVNHIMNKPCSGNQEGQVNKTGIENKQINRGQIPNTQNKQQGPNENKINTNNNSNQKFNTNERQPHQINKYQNQDKQICKGNQLPKEPYSLMSINNQNESLINNKSNSEKNNDCSNINQIPKQNNLKQYHSQQIVKVNQSSNLIRQEQLLNPQLNVRPLFQNNNNENANLPNHDVNNNFHSIKEQPQRCNFIPQKHKSKNNQNNPPNHLSSSYSQNNIFPVYNSYNDKITRKKKHIFQRPNSQTPYSFKEQSNVQEIKDSYSKLSPNQNISPTRDCFACNVQCNISATGYSPMTYSPYGDRKRRRSVTPI